MVQPEKRLLWHPRRDNKFVVGGGSQVTLYEWKPDFPEIRHITSQQDLNFMKCFAWSPDPAFDDLIAVGLSTGKVDLIRLEAGKQAQRKNTLSSGPTVTLPVRNSRSCNALAFNNVDSNYLAVGLDKVRGDSSLVIWDINTATSSLALPLNDSTSNVTAQARPQPLLPRLDNHMRADPRVLQQHAPTEVVSSLAFLPSSTNLILAGISHRWLRLFDLRVPSATPANVAAKVHGIVTDPFDPHRIACFGDAAVTVWDSRRLSQPILMFSERDALADGAVIRPNPTVVNVEFSSTRRGCLATMEKDAEYVRFWNISESRVSVVDGSVTGGGSSDGETTRSKDSMRVSKRSWAANLPWPTGGTSHNQPLKETLSSSVDFPTQRSFVLSDTRRTKNFNQQLASFALVPSLKSSLQLTSNVMVVNKHGDLELYAIHDTPKQLSWSARGSFAIGAGLGLKVIEGYNDSDSEDEADSEEAVQPAKLVSDKGRQSRSHSIGPSRAASRTRGREASVTRARGSQALFGRGDEDGFPALSTRPTGLSATRPGKSRTYSPASIRHYRSSERGEPSALQRRSLSRTDTLPAEELPKGPVSPPQVAPRKIERSPKVKEAKKQGAVHIVEDDISMIMRRRAKAGYGLSQPALNVKVTENGRNKADLTSPALSILWSWIQNSQEILCVPTPRLHGFDFSYHGLLGIWEGFAPIEGYSQFNTEEAPLTIQKPLLLDLPVLDGRHRRAGNNGKRSHSSRRSHSPAEDLQGNWSAALATLASRRNIDRWSWKSPVPTNKTVARQVALQICGWSPREEEMLASVKRWEKEGKLSKAACWLVFVGQLSKAAELLMRSEDQTHQMMSGTIATLAPFHSHSGSSKGTEIREHYGRLIIRLHDPYFRVMLTHLIMGDWSEVLEEEVIPFSERLIIAFLFLDDKMLSSYLHRIVERARTSGDIDAITITGLTTAGLDIIQSYVDRTGDIQSAAILSSYVCPQKFRDKRAERWLEAYRDLLDGFKLHHLRVGFDIERGQMLQGGMHIGGTLPAEWAPRQILIRCHYCSKPVRSSDALPAKQKGRPTACENCNRELPRCSVCLLTLSILHDAAREIDLGYTHHRDTFDDAMVICQTCRHGGHAAHILEWFLGENSGRTHNVCPVADCNCRCADEF